MTAPATLEQPATTDDPDICHYVCICDPNLALCGHDCTDDVFWATDDGPPACPMCAHMADKPCPRCGWHPGDDDV